MGSSSDNSQNFDSIKSLHEPRGVIKKKKKKQQVHTLFSEGSLICFVSSKNNSTRLPHRLASKGVYSKCNVGYIPTLQLSGIFPLNLENKVRP